MSSFAIIGLIVLALVVLNGIYVAAEIALIGVSRASLHAVAQGMTYFDMLMSQGSPVVRKDVVPNVTHGGLYESPAGLDLIKDILLKECGTQDD